ncbi:FG-GAP repeat domain-containing protein [Dactylosporangium sp. CA-139066]|uniref:FG-GAP repeat domain-containing protein n=1 Tax=Dactylosporangium sp. CA-139066 TaxID=3239930 RepID=UPI003D902EB3
MAFRALAGLLTVGVATAAAFAGPTTAAHADSSVAGPITQNEVLSRAQYWVNQGVLYGTVFDGNGNVISTKSAPDPAGRNYRTDCSGLVSMTWHLSWSPTTDDFQKPHDSAHPWTVLPGLDSFQPGDAMVKNGHIELFAFWKVPTDHHQGAYVYSFNSTNETVQNPYANSNFGNRGFNSWNDLQNYTPIRYDNILPSGASYSGDSKADLLYVDTASTGNISEYPNLSPGNWGTTATVGSGWAGVDPNSVYFADMNGDGKTDLLQLKNDSILYYQNNGPGNWGTTTTIGSGWTGVDPKSIYFADMNGDGKADLLQLKNGLIYFYPSNGPGNWGTTTTIGSGWAGVNPESIYFADMNGDGKADMLQLKNDSVLYFPNLSPGNWGTTATIGSGWTGVDPKTVYFADMNGDGQADLLQYKNNYIYDYPNLSPGNWGTTTAIGSGWTASPDTLHFA